MKWFSIYRVVMLCVLVGWVMLTPWECGVMGCTPTKSTFYPSERYVNSLVYHIHSSAPPAIPDPNETKIIQEDIVDSVEDPKSSPITEFHPKDWLQKATDMNSVHLRGHWIAGVTGGGCRNNVEMFSRNPQYQLSILSRGSSELLIGLYQELPAQLPIGFNVYKSEVKNQRLTAEYLLFVQPVYTSGVYRCRDVIWGLCTLPRGHYTIIVSSYKPSSAKYELVVHSCATLEIKKLNAQDPLKA